jgi:hypothetical protein
MKSKDLKNWTYLGEFLRNELPDVTVGEDISCGNFFKLGDKWMLLCISHYAGCRYYLGGWSVRECLSPALSHLNFLPKMAVCRPVKRPPETF